MPSLVTLNTKLHAHLLRLKHLEDFSAGVSEAHDLYSGQPASTHLHDPVNAFQLVNRYFNTWMKLHNNVYSDNSKGKVVFIMNWHCH